MLLDVICYIEVFIRDQSMCIIVFRFCKHTDENKRQKVALILDKLITMTIDEVEMYPSIQAKIWGNIGQVSDLLDMVLDSFIKVTQDYSLCCLTVCE